MAHLRERFLARLLADDLKWSPAVAVFGMRQVGKSTLVKGITDQFQGDYETFDREATAQGARQMPLQFCERTSLLTIDEAQKVPGVFPAIKDTIGTRRRAGRFLLTGSVRFTWRGEIREALTGRILIRELLPFFHAELEARSPRSLALAALLGLAQTADEARGRVLLERYFARAQPPSESEILRQSTCGGLPTPCFTRDPVRRRAWFDAYVETLLTRDVVLVDEALAAIPLRLSQTFLRALAQLQGSEVNYRDLVARSGLRVAQAKGLVQALDALCVIERIAPEVHSKKTTRKLRIEWKDCGLRNHVAGEPVTSVRDLSHSAIQLAIGQQIRGQLQILGHPPAWSFYRSRDGGSVPWIIRAGAQCIAITYVPDEAPKPYDYRALKRLIEGEKNGIGIVLGATRSSIACLGPRLWLMPWQGIF